MKLLMLAVFGVAMVAMATEQDKGAEFVVLDDDSEKSDVDPDVMDDLESKGQVAEYLEQLLQQDSKSSLRSACVLEKPLGYTTALRSREALFDNSSATNDAVNDQEEASGSSTSLSRNARQVTSLYYCPHRNYLLRWFPLYAGSTLTDICYVPWASSQAITYARCSWTTCRLPYNRRGRCRPSCFTRRRILAICYNLRLRRWWWRWVLRSLPQACRCSTC